MAAATAGLAFAPAARGEATVKAIWSGNAGNWTDPLKWTMNPPVPTYPDNGNAGETFDVTINAGAVTLDTDVTIESLTLAAGSVTGPGSLTLNGTNSTWAGGTMSGIGTTRVNGSLLIRGNTTLSGRALDVAGTATHASGDWSLSGGATVNVLAGGSLALGGFLFAAPGTSAVVNVLPGGTLTSRTSGGIVSFPGTFNNAGTFHVPKGTFALQGGSSSGSFQLDAGASLLTGNYTFRGGTTFTGPGSVDVGRNHTLTLADNVDIPNLLITGGTVAGIGDLTLSGQSGVEQETSLLTGTGATLVTGSLTLGLNTYGRLTTDRALDVSGMLVAKNARITLRNGAGLRVLPGGTFTAPTLYEITGDAGSTFVNAGLFERTSGIGSTSITVPATNQFGGTLRAGAGTLVFTSLTNAGSIVLDGGGIRVTSSFWNAPGATVAGDGTLSFGTAQARINAPVRMNGWLSFENSNAYATADIDVGVLAVVKGSRLTLRPATDTAVPPVLRIRGFSFDLESTLALGGSPLIWDYENHLPLGIYYLSLRWHLFHGSITGGDGSTVVGYAEAADVVGPDGGTFAGQAVDGRTLLARATLPGDTNLSGTVDFTDLVTLAQNYNRTDGKAHWPHGDFNYDGNVDFADLVVLAQSYNGAIPTGVGDTAFQSDLATAFASVPEPVPVPLLIGAAALITTRRRRA